MNTKKLVITGIVILAVLAVAIILASLIYSGAGGIVCHGYCPSR